MKDFCKIPEDLLQEIKKNTEEISAKNRKKVQEFDLYSEFVEGQKKYFQEDVDKILRILDKLILEGKLYIYTRLISRIKDPESALHNDDISLMEKTVLMGKILDQINEEDYTLVDIKNNTAKIKKEKVLDDVFGVTVITDTDKEIQYLLDELKNNFHIAREKKLNKEGYHATHLFLWDNEKNFQSPIIECQLKTMKEHINSYDHTLYKTETNIQRILYEKGQIETNKKPKLNERGRKKVEEIIQEYYENNGFSIFTNIPRMWEATFVESKETMELRNLTEAQTLKRVYPSLIIRSDKLR